MKIVGRLYVFCEGQTEETFTNLVLAPHFASMFGATAYPLLLPNKKGAPSAARRAAGTATEPPATS
jgi:hypothetical protein